MWPVAENKYKVVPGEKPLKLISTLTGLSMIDRAGNYQYASNQHLCANVILEASGRVLLGPYSSGHFYYCFNFTTLYRVIKNNIATKKLITLFQMPFHWCCKSLKNCLFQKIGWWVFTRESTEFRHYSMISKNMGCSGLFK